MLIPLRCSLSVIILSSVFSLLFSSQSLSDPRRHSRSLHRSFHHHGCPSELLHSLVLLFSRAFSSSLVSSFFQHCCDFYFSTINPLSLSQAPVRVCIWVLCLRLHRPQTVTHTSHHLDYFVFLFVDETDITITDF